MAAAETAPDMDPYADADKVPARVEVKNRPLRDAYPLIFFLAIVLANLALGAVVVSTVKDAYGLATDYNACIDNNGITTQTKIDAGAAGAASAAAQDLASSSAASISVDGISRNPGTLIGLAIAVLAVAGLWVFLLYRFTATMVWGTLIFNVCLTAGVGVIFIAILPDGAGTQPGAVYLVIAAFQALVLYCVRANVNMAAGLINLAMQALADYPSLILAAILLNVMVLGLYIIQLIFIIAAFFNIGFVSMTGAAIREAGIPISGSIQAGESYCVVQPTGIANFGRYFFAVTLLWFSATLEAIRMALTATVFGTFYYFAPDDPDKPANIVCMATTWAFTKQLGTHAISGMVLAIIDSLKRMAKSRQGGIAGIIIRIIIQIILSCIEQLTKFLVVMTGLTGLSFWQSAKRTMKVMASAFVDGYITSRITIRVLRLSGFIFAFVFAVIAWAAVDSSSFQTIWWFLFIIIIGIISPIFGIVLALVLSTILGAIFNSIGSGDTTNPLSGPLAGLFFGAIAHAVLLFMEQLILDLVDAAFVCFALDTHNGIISPRGEVVHRFMGANFADQLSDEGKTMAGKAPPGDAAVANPVPVDSLPPPGAPAAAPPKAVA